jgi:hypothetical protein
LFSKKSWHALLKPDYALGIVGQQSFAIIQSAHGLFWIEVEGFRAYFLE